MKGDNLAIVACFVSRFLALAVLHIDRPWYNSPLDGIVVSNGVHRWQQRLNTNNGTFFVESRRGSRVLIS